MDQDYTFGHPGLLLNQRERARAVLLRERPDIQERRLTIMGVAPPSELSSSGSACMCPLGGTAGAATPQQLAPPPPSSRFRPTCKTTFYCLLVSAAKRCPHPPLRGDLSPRERRDHLSRTPSPCGRGWGEGCALVLAGFAS